MISPEQIRAARAMLDWSTADLSRLSGLTINGLNKIERGQVTPHKATLEVLEKLFEGHGLEFIRDTGVNRRDNTLQVIEGADAYFRLLDDIFYTLKEQQESEVLFAFVRNKLSSAQSITSDLRLRKSGMKFRSLIEEGDTYCLYPLAEYRQIPTEFFYNNPQIIYGTKVGTMIYKQTDKTALIVNNPHFAAIQRNMFNLAWKGGRIVKKTSAPETYE